MRLLRPYSDVVGRDRFVLDLEGSTFLDLVEKVVEDHPKLGEEILDDAGNLDYAVNAVLNDKVLTAEEFGTPLKDGDVVTLMAPISGG